MKNLLTNSISRKNPNLLFFTGIYFLLWQANNAKTILIPFVISLLFLFLYYNKNLFESVFISLLLSIPFENMIREWIIYSLPPQENSGYYYSFGLTPKLILSFLAFLLIITPRYQTLFKKIRWNNAIFLLLLFFTIAVFTSVFFQYRTTTVFVGLVRLLISIFLYLLSHIFFSLPGRKKYFIYFIVALSIFSVYVGSLQLIKQHQVGKFLELTPSFSETGYLTTDGKPQFRVSSFISHPVYFGSFISIMVPILIGIILQNQNIKIRGKEIFYLGVAFVLLTTFVLLGTLSRSVWINIGVIGLLFFLFLKHNRFVLPGINSSPFFKKYLLPVVLLTVSMPLFILLVTRTLSVPSLFKPGGSGSVRLNLALQSWKFVKAQPWTGIGLNNSVFEQYVGTRLPNTIIAPPHNTFLLFLSELGLPATIIFIGFIVISLYPRGNPFAFSPVTFGVWVGLLTFLISSQFHPLFNLDPTFDMFMVILGYLSTCQPFRT